jgi:hypothetical protein
MATPLFEKLAAEIEALSPEEQRHLRDLLDRLLAKPGKALTMQDELDQLLLQDGVISEIPPPITDLTPYQDRKRIDIQGKPLSETIIEERR